MARLPVHGGSTNEWSVVGLGLIAAGPKVLWASRGLGRGLGRAGPRGLGRRWVGCGHLWPWGKGGSVGRGRGWGGRGHSSPSWALVGKGSASQQGLLARWGLAGEVIGGHRKYLASVGTGTRVRGRLKLNFKKPSV